MLVSGGLDSAVLLAEEAASRAVQPIYVSVGLAWEAAERATLVRFLSEASLGPGVRPVVQLTVDMRDVYAPDHWAVQGRPPAYDTPDEDVYLHGRNIVLLGKAGVFCGIHGIERLVLGTLNHNPFPDATPEFLATMGSALSLGLARTLKIEAPLARARKADVIRRGIERGLPLAFTLSCMSPVNRESVDLPVHCGVCSKCRERHEAFVEAGFEDPTEYASQLHVSARP